MFRLSVHRALFLRAVGLVVGAVAAISQPAHAGRYFFYHFTPWENVVGRDGNFYGSAMEGGLAGEGGCVYRLTPRGQFRLVSNFPKARLNEVINRQGRNPEGLLSVGDDGGIYGCTRSGGVFGRGVVYKVEPNGRREVIHHLNSSYYKFSVLRARNGNIYVADDSHAVIRIAPDGSTARIPRPGNDFGVRMVETANGAILLTDDAPTPSPPVPQYVYRLNESERFEPLATCGFYVSGLLALPNADGSVIVCSDNRIQRVYEDGSGEVLHDFSVPFEGQGPQGLFLVDQAQSIIGHTATGGLQRQGVVFKLDLATHDYTVLEHLGPYDRRGPGPRWARKVLPRLAEAAAEHRAPATQDDFVEASALQVDATSGGLPSARVEILRNDREVPGGPLQAFLIELPLHGTAILDPSTNEVIYTADSATPSYDAFTYMVMDGAGKTSVARVVVRPDRTGEYTGEVVTVPALPQEQPVATAGSLAVRMNGAGACTGTLIVGEKTYRLSGRFNDRNLCGVELAANGRTGQYAGIQLWLKPNGAAWEVHAEIVDNQGSFSAVCAPAAAAR